MSQVINVSLNQWVVNIILCCVDRLVFASTNYFQIRHQPPAQANTQTKNQPFD